MPNARSCGRPWDVGTSRASSAYFSVCRAGGRFGRPSMSRAGAFRGRAPRGITGEAGWSARHQQEVPMPLSLPIEPAAAKLLQDSPLALLMGMLLDQQIPMEKAFSSPYVLTQRLGHGLDA